MTTLAADDDTRRPSTPVVQMTISTPETVDLMGRFLPAGNYYFTAKHFYKDMICGTLKSKGIGTFGEFCFTNKELVRMMAIAQSRLARRADIDESGMPTYSSPVPARKKKRPRPPTPKVCSICCHAPGEQLCFVQVLPPSVLISRRSVFAAPSQCPPYLSYLASTSGREPRKP